MIIFRHLVSSDFADLKTFVSNLDVTKYLTWNAYDGDEEITAFLEKAKKKLAFPNEYIAIVIDDVLIGTVHLIDRGNGCVQYGFGIIPKYWGNGLGKQIVEKTLLYVSQSSWRKNVKEIWADTHKDNNHAINILLNLGFVYTGYVDDNLERQRYIFYEKNNTC